MNTEDSQNDSSNHHEKPIEELKKINVSKKILFCTALFATGILSFILFSLIGTIPAIMIAGSAGLIVILLDGLGLVRDPNTHRFTHYAWVFVFCLILCFVQIGLQINDAIEKSVKQAEETKQQQLALEQDQAKMRTLLLAIHRQSLLMKPKEWSLQVSVRRYDKTADLAYADMVIEGKLEKSVDESERGGNAISVEFIGFDFEQKTISGGRGGGGGNYLKMKSRSVRFDNYGNELYLDKFDKLVLRIPDEILDGFPISMMIEFSTGLQAWTRTFHYKRTRINLPKILDQKTGFIELKLDFPELVKLAEVGR